MMTTADIYALIDKRRTELGLSQLQLGQAAFGRPDTSAIQNLKRGSSPTFERLSAIADALGLELYLGRPRAFTHGFAEPAGAAELDRKDHDDSHFLPIPWHDMARQPGSSPVAFSREWMEANALVPDNLRAVAPDVIHLPEVWPKGAVAVVDISSHRLRQSGLCAFKRLAQVHIGYVTFMRDLAVILEADPSAGATVIFPDDDSPIRSLGQVVWSAHIWR